MSQICRVVTEAKYTAREKRERRLDKPQPWIVLKLTVGITILLMLYAGYVYIGRFCVPIILRDSGHTYASRGTGIALLIVFCVLALWELWAYFMAVTTPPGFARDYVQKSPQPFPPPMASVSTPANLAANQKLDLEKGVQKRHRLSTSSSDPDSSANSTTVGGPSYDQISQGVMANPNRPAGAPQTVGDAQTNANSPSPPQNSWEASPSAEVDVTDSSSPPENTASSSSHPNANGTVDTSVLHPGADASSYPLQQLSQQLPPPRPASPYVMAPPPIPYLRPEHRYCARDGIVKPYRAHHCRACGTCVLKFDHHCPWIGQCVGARNHKFFVNFCQSTMVSMAYLLATLIAYMTRADNIDPQIIVIIALAGLFFIFTSSLFISHTILIWHTQTTVENVASRNLKERIKYHGGGSKSFFGSQKRVKVFKQEWGDPDTEGNLWWMGSGRKGWEDVMGTSPLGWILPIGRPLSDGLDYKPNWRFDEEGRWRLRKDWPKEPVED